MKTRDKEWLRRAENAFLAVCFIGMIACVVLMLTDNTRLSETAKACGEMGRAIEEGKTYYFDAQGKQWLIVLEEIE